LKKYGLGLKQEEESSGESSGESDPYATEEEIVDLTISEDDLEKYGLKESKGNQ
jgi:hypothetical protein